MYHTCLSIIVINEWSVLQILANLCLFVSLFVWLVDWFNVHFCTTWLPYLNVFLSGLVQLCTTPLHDTLRRSPRPPSRMSPRAFGAQKLDPSKKFDKYKTVHLASNRECQRIQNILFTTVCNESLGLCRYFKYRSRKSYNEKKKRAVLYIVV